MSDVRSRRLIVAALLVAVMFVVLGGCMAPPRVVGDLVRQPENPCEVMVWGCPE